MFKPLTNMSHIIFFVRDLSKSLAFYRDTLDFKVQMEEYNLVLGSLTVSVAVVERADDVIGMVELAQFPPSQQNPVAERGFFDLGFWAVAWEVKALDHIYRKWLERDVKFTQKPTVLSIGSQGQYYAAIMSDADGNRIELVQRLD